MSRRNGSRRPGAGRKPTISKDPTLLSDLEALVEPNDPWGSGITAAVDLQERAPSGAGAASAGSRGQPHPGRPLAPRGGLQSARATARRSRANSHPDRDAQFRLHQPTGSSAFQRQRPAGDLGGHQEEGTGRRISRTTGGSGSPRAPRGGAGPRLRRSRNWARRSPTASTTWPANAGWVSVGIDHDTAEFAVRQHSPVVAQRWSSRVIPRQPDC